MGRAKRTHLVVHAQMGYRVQSIYANQKPEDRVRTDLSVARALRKARFLKSRELSI